MKRGEGGGSGEHGISECKTEMIVVSDDILRVMSQLVFIPMRL